MSFTRKPLTPQRLLMDNLGMFYGLIDDVDVRKKINELFDMLNIRENTNYIKAELSHKKNDLSDSINGFIAMYKKYHDDISIEQFKVDIKERAMINALLEKLKKYNIRYDTYIDWLFNEWYSVEFNTSTPPSIKNTCGYRVSTAFFMKMKPKIKQNIVDDEKNKRVEMLLERAYAIIDSGNVDFNDYITEYEKGAITPSYFEEMIAMAEEKESLR